MKYAYYDFKFGRLMIGYEGGTLFKLKCKNDCEGEGERSPFSDEVFKQVSEYLEGKRQSFDLSFKLGGTEFQKRVWKALLKIPCGETKTYGEIAAAAGSPKAARPVGSACKNNPLWLIVPCHRVVGSASLGGYAGGLKMKKALLDLESRAKVRLS